MNMPPVPRADIALVTLGGLLLVIAAVVAGAREATPAWGKHQDARAEGGAKEVSS